jgi:hypothetical protein
MFFHLDNSHVKNQENTPTLVSCGLRCFKLEVYDKTKAKVLPALFAIINRERDGESVDRAVIRECVKVLKIMGCHTKLDLKKVTEFTRMEDLCVYNDDFETPLLHETRVFYSAKAVSWLATGSTPGYLKEVEDAINRERNEGAAYMSKGTVPQLLKVPFFFSFLPVYFFRSCFIPVYSATAQGPAGSVAAGAYEERVGHGEQRVCVHVCRL